MSTHQSSSPQCEALMSCLSEYIDGELEADVCAEIDRHLAVCEECRMLVDTSRKTIQLYRHHFLQATVELPPDTRTRLWQALSDAGCVSK